MNAYEVLKEVLGVYSKLIGTRLANGYLSLRSIGFLHWFGFFGDKSIRFWTKTEKGNGVYIVTRVIMGFF